MKMTPEAFERFDKANPQVWEDFIVITERLIAEGVRDYSADHILHGIRRDRRIKILNATAAFYARKWRHAFPHHPRIFLERPSIADTAFFAPPPQLSLAL